MKTTKISQGRYNVNVHGHSFTLERLYGSKHWTLSNRLLTEVLKLDTKSAVLETMSYWTQEHTKEQAESDLCAYA